LAAYSSQNRGFHGFGVAAPPRQVDMGRRDEIAEKEILKKKLFEASRKIRSNLRLGGEERVGRRRKFGRVFEQVKNAVEVFEVNSSNIMGWVRM
jgi:hypothetical protein